MATKQGILAELRTAIAALATSRDPAVNFLEHTTNDPFAESPVGGSDGFYVEEEGSRILGGFGREGDKEAEVTVRVHLGHAPYGTDLERDNYVARDTERLADIIERRAWTLAGVEAVFLVDRSTLTDKSNPNWWRTQMDFRINYTGAIETV